MSEKIIQNWLALAEYDLKTAQAMLQTERFLYVAFACQQAMEKLLKAVYVKEKNQTPPYTHNQLWEQTRELFACLKKQIK
jgi:HEPN domain-containing protein